jgi:hypothetical protein
LRLAPRRIERDAPAANQAEVALRARIEADSGIGMRGANQRRQRDAGSGEGLRENEAHRRFAVTCEVPCAPESPLEARA